MEFSLGWRISVYNEGKNGWRVPEIFIFPHSHLHCALFCPALYLGKLTCVDYNSVALGLPVLFGSREPLPWYQDGEGGRGISSSSPLPAGLLRVNLTHQPEITSPSKETMSTQSPPSRFCRHPFPVFLWVQECNRSAVLSVGYWTIPWGFPTCCLVFVNSPFMKRTLNYRNLRMPDFSSWTSHDVPGTGSSSQEAHCSRLPFWWLLPVSYCIRCLFEKSVSNWVIFYYLLLTINGELFKARN